MERRDFLRSAVAGLAATTATTSSAQQASAPGSQEKKTIVPTANPICGRRRPDVAAATEIHATPREDQWRSKNVPHCTWRTRNTMSRQQRRTGTNLLLVERRRKCYVQAARRS